jgi:hypothetical protein
MPEAFSVPAAVAGLSIKAEVIGTKRSRIAAYAKSMDLILYHQQWVPIKRVTGLKIQN